MNEASSSSSPPSHTKKVKLMSGVHEYSIVDDLKNSKPDISFSQLLDVSPKIRSELSKGLKLEPYNFVAAIDEKDVAAVEAIVNNISARLLVDTCSNMNLINKKFLDNLPIKYNIVSTESCNIHQAINDSPYMFNSVVHIPFSIGSLHLEADFHIIDNKSNFYDLLIGLKTHSIYNLFVNTIAQSVCCMNSDGSWNPIAPLINNSMLDNNIICLIENTSVCPSPTDYISDPNFLCSLDSDKKVPVINLLSKYNSILATSSKDLSPSKLLPHSINLVDGAKPFKQRSYKLSKIQSDVLKEELKKLIDNKLIVPSHSPWSSPVLLVPKKNGKWRMCVDYRKLNDLTMKDSYSLPYIDEILFSAGGNMSFMSTIDLFSGFHQIPMNKNDIEKTCFTTKYGNYNFVVMPFGLCNAPATFQREMNRIFFPLIGDCLFIYMDDLVIFSPTFEKHLIDIERVLKIMKENDIKVNLEKSHFFRSEVEVLGHKLTTKGIKPMDTKILAIANWTKPLNITELRSFLGAVGYYRKFISRFSQLANPLFGLLKKNAKYEWSEKQESSFNLLKDMLIKAPILQFPNFKNPFIIRTDASLDGIGGVLLQKNEKGIELPIHYVSRTLHKSEVSYSITDLEGTAAFFCCKKFKPYISGSSFNTILFTDHQPLVGLFSNKEPNNPRQTRWCLTLSMLKVEVKYEPGKKNVLADALSRMPSNIVLTMNKELETSRTISEILESKFIENNGILYYKDNNNLRKVIDEDKIKERYDLIEKAHGIGHEGTMKTYERLKRDYYWKNMLKDVKTYVKCCHKCQLFRPQPIAMQTETHPTPPELPFTKVGLDIIGPLPMTKKNNQYIIVLVDYFTKWVEAEPLVKTESTDVIQFLTKVFSRHGIPEVLITDNGTQFTSDATKGFLDLYGIFVHYTNVYHPESNGEVENRNREIGKYLRLLSEKEKDWDEVLPSALWALRTCKNVTTGYSSFELLYGRRDLQPFELILNLDPKHPEESIEEYLIRRFTTHQKWVLEAIENINNANKLWMERRQQINNMKRKYEPGDLVLVRTINRAKLEPYYHGPLKIVKIQFHSATVCDPKTNEIAKRNVHIKNLVPYYSRETSRDEV